MIALQILRRFLCVRVSVPSRFALWLIVAKLLQNMLYQTYQKVLILCFIKLCMAAMVPCQFCCCCYPIVVSHQCETPTNGLARKIKIFGPKTRARFLWGISTEQEVRRILSYTASNHKRSAASTRLNAAMVMMRSIPI